MDKIIGVCGITCTDCPAYKATQADDDAQRKQVAETWSKAYTREMYLPEFRRCQA